MNFPSIDVKLMLRVHKIDFRFSFAYIEGRGKSGVSTGKRADVLTGQTMQIASPFGTVFVILNESADGSPFEIFVKVGKSGSDMAADAEAIGRLCTLLLRVPSEVSELDRLEFIIKHLSGIGGSKQDSGTIRSIADGVARALSLYLFEKNISRDGSSSSASGNLCGSCGQMTLCSGDLEWCECGWTNGHTGKL